MAPEFAPFSERIERSALRDAVRSTYVSPVRGGPAPFVLHVLPDAFVDILWGPAGRLRVAGPDRRFRRVELPPGQIVAVRFDRAAAGTLLGVPVSELTDQRVALEDLWGAQARTLSDRLAAAGSPADGLAVLRTALLDRLPGTTGRDDLVRAAVAALRRSPAMRIAGLSEELGVGERQLRRRFTAALGYGPKRAQRIFRLHRFAHLIRRCAGGPGLAELAGMAGFVDQAHLTHDCVELLGFTPAALVRMTVGPFPARRPGPGRH